MSGPRPDALPMPARPRLAIALDCDDLDNLAAEGIAPRDLALLAMDPDLHISLGSATRHFTPWDFVEREDWPQVRAFSEEVWRFWETHASVPHAGFDLLRIAPYRHYECLTKLSWACFVVRRAFERLQPAEVVTFAESDGHGLSQPPAYRKYPPLFALVRGMAEHAGVPLRLVPRRGAKFVDLAGSATLSGALHREAERGELPNRPYVLLYGNGVDLLQQLPLVRELEANGALSAVQVYKVADTDTLASARAIGHPVLHEFTLQEAVGRPPEINLNALRAAAERGCARLVGAARRAGGPLRAIFDNAHLHIHFGFVFGEYVLKIARHVATWSQLCRTRPPAAVVAHDQVPLTYVAGACGVPCLSLSHGLVLGDARWYGGLTPVVGAVSPAHRERLIAAGMRGADVTVTGSLWLDRFMQSDEMAPAAREGEEHARLRAALGVPPDRRLILVCTSTVGTFSKSSNLPHAHWRDALDDLRGLVQLAARRRDWAVIVKAHPRYDHADFYEQLRRELPEGAACRVTTTLPLDDLAAAADAIVLPNVLSSTLVEVSFAGRPVFVLDRCLLGYEPRAYLAHGWPHVHSVAELEDTLASVLGDAGAWRDAAERTRAALRAMLGSSFQRAAPRCAAWLREAAQRPRAEGGRVQHCPAGAR